MAFAGAQEPAAKADPAAPASDWWAYRPLARPSVPDVGEHPFVRTDLDRFVLHALRQKGLEPSPPADRATLIRRVTYDLTGLPPSPEDVAAFVADEREEAYAELVERLLASPQYGVKWARHWLDLVRYAETNSFERDAQKPHVWRYRDWVVEAFQKDVPWGEFLSLQLAGDEREDGGTGALVATGYFRLGQWDDEPTDPLQAVYDDFDGIVDTTARAMLATSMGCARCHDHKKDPIPTKDYYSFLAFFENVAPYRQAHFGAGLAVDHFVQRVPEDGARAVYERELAVFTASRDEGIARANAAARADWLALDATSRVQRLESARRSLLAAYRLERSDAAHWLDEVAAHHGDVAGQVVPVDGHAGQGGRFDGDDHVVLPVVAREAFTISLWLRTTHGGQGRGADLPWYATTGLVDGEMPGVVNDFGLGFSADGRAVAGVGAPDVSIATPPGLADGAWHHVAFTRERDSGRIAIYCDGAFCAEATGTTAVLDAPQRLVVGRAQPGGRGFRGDLDELLVFGRALSPQEVAALALELPGGLASASSRSVGDALLAVANTKAPQLATVEVLCARETSASPKPSHVLVRGDAHSPGEAVEPRVPSVLGGHALEIAPANGGKSSGRRTALARWIASPDNPLTWRAIANRLVQHHLGRGLVRSTNDFGRLGDLPTHPELLDWLACELVAKGQSLKAAHRLILSSGVYRQACAVDASKSAIDPLNDGFWRFDRRRLSAEEVRDAMLAAAGVLNPELGGPSVYPPLPAAVLATSSRPDEAWGTSTPEQAARRSLYVHVKRSLQDPLLAAFDAADTDSSCPVRYATVQPTQALMLLNGDFAHRTAQQFAERLTRERADLRARIERGLFLVTCRTPREADVARLSQLAADLQQQHGRSEAEALQRVCLLLLNANEFLYLD